jgi:hypothetical protein
LPYKSFFDASPLVLLDGVPVFNMDKVIRMDPLKIKKLEVVSRKFYQDYFAYSGIMSYSTYQGDLGGFVLDPNAIVVRYDGLQIKRKFYSPLYESPEQQQSRLPDFRTTLYWSADLQTSQQSKQISFYTSDVPGTYLVVAEGITEDGKVASGKWSFEVKGK